MDVTDLHQRTVAGFVSRLDTVGDRWSAPTPCSDWDVRALVNHIAYEDLWTVPLMEGATIAEEYAYQLAADHLIHGWDLAAATGGDRRFDPELVDAIAAWFENREVLFRGAGIIAERPSGVASDDPQDQLLLAFGRRPDSRRDPAATHRTRWSARSPGSSWRLRWRSSLGPTLPSPMRRSSAPCR